MKLWNCPGGFSLKVAGDLYRCIRAKVRYYYTATARDASSKA